MGENERNKKYSRKDSVETLEKIGLMHLLKLLNDK